MYRIILASESPRRREIMETMGIQYEVMASNVIEVADEEEPAEMVQALAALKTKNIVAKLKQNIETGQQTINLSVKELNKESIKESVKESNTELDKELNKEINKELDNDIIIIGADTMVFYKEHALGKPKDEADAVRILQLLSNHTHEVYTGVSIIIIDKYGEDRMLSFAVSTKVTVHPLTPEQIADYVATGEPMDKAGAYAIQGKFGIHIKEISGDYYNIVGFPIAKIYETLLNYGIDIKKIK